MRETPGRCGLQDIPQQESELSRLIPVCGGLVPAVLFSRFEEMFRQAGPGTKEITGTSQQWLDLLHMKLSWFSKAFSRIGISHVGGYPYVLARIEGRQFWSPRLKKYLFYSLERADRGQRCTLRRNAELIGRTLRELDGIYEPREVHTENRGAVTAAREDARAFIQKYLPD